MFPNCKLTEREKQGCGHPPEHPGDRAERWKIRRIALMCF
jgi:hypothetical protein